jgi:hypothetical protein
MAPKQALSIVMIALMVCGIVFGCLGTGKAESTNQPSVPQFTLQYIERPGFTPTIEITITNQPIAVVNESNNYFYNIYYNFQFKSHSLDNWASLNYISNTTNQLVVQSESEHTVISLPIFYLENAIGNEVDVQVQAYIATGVREAGPIGHWTWTQSGWSSTQTVVVPASSYVTPVPSLPTTIPTQFSGNSSSFPIDWIGVIAIAALGLVAVLLVFVVVLGRRIRRLEPKVAS